MKKSQKRSSLIKLSYSKISTINQCLYKYFLKYIKKEREIVSPAAKGGKILHDVVAKFWENKKNWIITNVEEKTFQLQELMINELNKRKNYHFSEDELNNISKNFIIHFFNILADLQKIVGIEKKFSFRINNYQVVGIMDFVYLNKENNLHIIDYKTGNFIPNFTNIENKLQLGIYNIAANFTFKNFKNCYCSLYFLKYGLETPLELNNENLLDIQDFIISSAGKINTKHFPKTTNNFCKWCSYNEICSKEK